MQGIQLVEIGRVSRLHGFQGALVITTPSGKESSLSALKQIWIGKDSGSAQSFEILTSSWMPKGWKMELARVEDEQSAKSLVGFTVFANRLDLPLLEKNEYYLSDLEQMTAMDLDTQKVIGPFIALEESDSSPHAMASYWLFKTPSGSLSVPAVAHFIHQVDSQNKIIWLKNLSELK